MSLDPHYDDVNYSPVWYRFTRSCWKERRSHPGSIHTSNDLRWIPAIDELTLTPSVVIAYWSATASPLRSSCQKCGRSLCVIRDEGWSHFIHFIFFFFCNAATAVDSEGSEIAAAPRENNGSVSALDSADFLSRRMHLVKIYECDIWEPHRQQRKAAARQTGALLSHTGFLLPDFRKIKWEKNSTTSTLPSLPRWLLTFWSGRRRRSNLLGSPDEQNHKLHLSIEGFLLLLLITYFGFSHLFFMRTSGMK